MEVPVKKNILLLASLLLLFAAVAQAHGPTRQKVVIKQQIAASPQAVWEVVKNFNDMSWHPAVTETKGDGGNAAGATRTLTLANGGRIHEKLEKYDESKHSFFYRIESVDVKVLPVTNYSSWFNIKPNGDGGSLVTWKGAFYRGYPNNDPPPELSDQAAKKAVSGVYESGLANLKKIVEKDT
ncbi:MAG: hypothetical protein B6D72_10535 [gamma proteobacterium symbiont of Ctena orbiculata]|uniref:SRPBCC family protein n=1 Tax=Candidatus Thiodiazotropha taylori TaxID=2792791 RepID=A0A944MC88_9GAMM|nr:SRPBCC family protein [Candidatus Thiodiazotropha taylori]PUB81454.1 MAG: hypothetical protein DBP00_18930 [gamma proteobacterium symbiont of Ctena orbiculata]MBT2991199.1 SRPBCC family protein [Candidatus Thiodiazotropha taylori]MBT2996507.1 SRPBCC family protein [Candidatus Thiodiazotropha taylori]MBT3000547.1 SRPBCC family protein [Candidatus Thiodiazotropha taylori]